MLQTVNAVQGTRQRALASRATWPVSSAPGTDRLSALAMRKRLQAREVAFHEGDPAEAVFEVIGGVLKLYKLLPDGRRQITGFAYPGQMVGIGQGEDYACTAEAVTDAVVTRYPRARLEALCDELPGLARRLLTLTAAELVAAQDQMLLLGRKSAVERIASFLLHRSEAAVARSEDPDELGLPMSRTDIADYLGLTIETTCRTLSQLSRDGVIEICGRHRIRLHDPDRLTELAAGERGGAPAWPRSAPGGGRWSAAA